MPSNLETNKARLEALCSQRLSQRRIVLASNRSPVEYHLTQDGQLQARRGSGGIVTALGSLSKYVEIDWIASAMREGDRKVVEKTEGRHFKTASVGENLYIRFIVTPRNTYHKY